MIRRLLVMTIVSVTVFPPIIAHADNLVFQDKPQSLPDISFQDADGINHHLHDFHGKTILLNLWATWCFPCRQEMPTLDRLQANLGSDKFQVVTLSIDTEGIDKVRKFFADLNIQHLPLYIDSSMKVAADLGASGLPTTLLINPDGQEIARLVGPAEWDSADMQTTLKRHIDGK